LDAYLVARSIAEQIERRIAYRRAMKQSIFRTLQAGALGIKIKCSGRLAGAEIARSQMMHQGRVPLHTLRADVDYGVTEAHTTMGRIGIKVWIYRGDVLPEIVSDVIDESPFGMIDETDGSDENIIAQTVESPVAAEEAPEKPKAKRTTKAKAVEKEEKPEEKAEEVPSAETAEAEKPKAKRKSKAEETVQEVVEKPVKKEKTADKPEETAEKPVKARAKKKDASEEA
jgi:small subunit ribosomal protein S3